MALAHLVVEENGTRPANRTPRRRTRPGSMATLFRQSPPWCTGADCPRPGRAPRDLQGVQPLVHCIGRTGTYDASGDQECCVGGRSRQDCECRGVEAIHEHNSIHAFAAVDHAHRADHRLRPGAGGITGVANPAPRPQPALSDTPKQEPPSAAHRIPDVSILLIPKGRWKRTGRGRWKPTGDGSFTGQDNGRYEGAFLYGKPHGLGTFTWADGSRYKGQFRNGKAHGRGTYIFPDGRVWTCEWRKNTIVTGSCEHDLTAERTWIARDREWTIELKMSGDYVYATVNHPVSTGRPLRCRGLLTNTDEIDARCSGGNFAQRKLVGTFPNVKLRNVGGGKAGGASFAFELDRESQEIN